MGWITRWRATRPPANDGGGRWRRVFVPTLVTLLAAGSAVLVVVVGKAQDPPTGGYPERIGFERPSDGLPDRPGRLAATLFDNDFGTGRSLGISPSGRVWELPPGTNVLSPSGTLLVSQHWDRAHELALHNLATGDEWLLRRVPSWWGGSAGRVHWAQDESAILASFGPGGRPHRGHPAVVDVSSGEVTDVGGGEPAGFRSPSEPVTVHQVGGPAATGGIVATTTDLDTGATRDLPLRLARPWLGDPDAPLVASTAPDGQTLLLIEPPASGSSDSTVRLFSLADGTERAPRDVRDWDGCAPRWRGQDPVIPVTTQPGGSGSTRWAGARLLTSDRSTSLVAVHPRLQSSCLQLADAALEAGPRWAFLGTRTALWTWYALPALIAVSLLALGLLLTVRTARRRGGGRAG